MTVQNTDDVTGEVIGGDTERWFRIAGLAGLFPQDVTDLDTVLQIIRDHLTGDSPAPLELYTIRRVPGDASPALAKYAPADEDAPADDGPFNTVQSFTIPNALPPRFRITLPPDMLPPLPPRVAKARAKYVRVLAECCGCNDLDSHERNIP